jgi:hypothetical protein
MKKSQIEIPQNLLYPVYKVASEELQPGILTNSYNSHAIVVETPGGKLKVNDCSSEYSLIRNNAIIEPIVEGLISRGHKIQVQGIAWNNAVFSFNIIAGLGPNEKVVVDKLYPSINTLNSYNGKIRCTSRLNIFRGLCENGLMLPEESMARFLEFSHTPSNEEHIAVGKILQLFEEFLLHADAIAEVYDDLKVSPVSNVEARVEEVIENTKFPKKFQEDVLDRINLEATKFHLKQTDWLVYNGFNYQLNHHEELVWDPKKRVVADQEILAYLLAN